VTFRTVSGLFVAEGNSDAPLAAIVESLFLESSMTLHLTAPDYSLLESRVGKDLPSRVSAGIALMGREPDVVVLHRDTDNTDHPKRRQEMEEAVAASSHRAHLVPVIPVRMTEAWLLLDEHAIRSVAGNPNGREPLDLPTVREAERIANPKETLQHAILTAAAVRGRRRKQLAARFPASRRRLLDGLSLTGAHSQLEGWKQLAADVRTVASAIEEGPF
jgi:hypothetical protein